MKKKNSQKLEKESGFPINMSWGKTTEYRSDTRGNSKYNI